MGKGVATLVGLGAASARKALFWAATTTAVGACLSFWLSGRLVANFSTAMFAPETPLSSTFFVAVMAGAFGWIALATASGLPVSTTHAIVGAIIGAGAMTFRMGLIHWKELTRSLVMPLVLSPILAMALAYLLTWVARFFLRRINRNQNQKTSPPRGSVVNRVHWLSSGMVGFARGWNDAPKIAALTIAALTLAEVRYATVTGFGLVIFAMAVGGLLAGRRVLETLARQITPMPLAESLTASMLTASVVCVASWAEVPVSTTHVSTGAIIGGGLRNDPHAVKWGRVGEILLAWLLTVPVAAALAAGVAIYLLP
jgi:inorganic phosphate transporter, PiT family